MKTRTLCVIGCVTAVAALLLLTGLLVAAFTADIASSPRYNVLCVADIMLGMAAASTLVTAAIRGDREGYIQGVGETIDRLASALPGESKVRRIG